MNLSRQSPLLIEAVISDEGQDGDATRTKCLSDPSVVSDPDRWRGTAWSGAEHALVNVDSVPIGHDYRWQANDGRQAHFVYDLGCMSLLSKLKLRNACNHVRRDT